MTPIFLLAGSPAVGKSTVARALAKNYPKSIHIPVDDVRCMVVSGLLHPSVTWTPELAEQMQLARESVVTMTLKYHEANFVVILDDFFDHHSLMNEYEPLWKLQEFIPVLLYPEQVQAKARNHRRFEPGMQRDYLDEGIDIVYGSLKGLVGDLEKKGWTILDTTKDSVEETVAKIMVCV